MTMIHDCKSRHAVPRAASSQISARGVERDGDRRSSSRAWRALVALILGTCTVLGGVRPGAAQNLLPIGGRFDDTVYPFLATPGLSHDPTLDRGGPAGSGSLKLLNDFGPVGNVVVATACLEMPVAAGGYYFEYWVRFAAGESGNGAAQVQFKTYPNDSCSGVPNGFTNGDAVGPVLGRGLWFVLRGGDITQPAMQVSAGTNSLKVNVVLSRTTASPISANFDALFFAPVGKPLCKGLVPTIGGKDIADTIFATNEADVIVTFDGDDTVFAGDGEDFVCAGKGADTVFGEGGDDALIGQGGADELYGDAGDDVLKGGAGADTLDGGSETDVCIGGGGGDGADASCEKVRKVP